MSAIFEADFERLYRADTSRLELYAAGRKALATNSAGELLRPEAVEEVENRYDMLLSNVTRLHREFTSLNKRAVARPAAPGPVAEGEQQITSTHGGLQRDARAHHEDAGGLAPQASGQG
jgi:hypothetical protein